MNVNGEAPHSPARRSGYRSAQPADRRRVRGIANDRLHSEKAVLSGFRTGVRFPSPPPNGTQTNTYFFSGGFAVKVMLEYEQTPLAVMNQQAVFVVVE